MPAAQHSGLPRQPARVQAARSSDSLLQPPGLRHAYGSQQATQGVPAGGGAAKSARMGKDGSIGQVNGGATGGKGAGTAAPLLINAYAAAPSTAPGGTARNEPGSPVHSGKQQGESRGGLSRMFPRRCGPSSRQNPIPFVQLRKWQNRIILQ